jgi:hypothetical protein
MPHSDLSWGAAIQSLWSSRISRWFLFGATVAVVTAVVTSVFTSGGVGYRKSSLRVIAGNDELCNVGVTREEASLGGIITELGEPIVRSSISVLSKYIEDTSTSTSTPVMTAIANTDLVRLIGQEKTPRVESNLNCIVLVTGRFGPSDDDTLKQQKYLSDNDPDEMFAHYENGTLSKKILSDVGLTELPNSFIELKFKRHEGALLLTPVAAYFRRANSHLAENEEKDVEITVTIVRPSPTGALDIAKLRGNAGLVAQIPIVIALIPGSVRRAQLPVKNYETVWISDLGIPDYIQSSIGAVRLAPKETRTVAPANVLVTYKEVDQPNLILKMIAGIVNESARESASQPQNKEVPASPEEVKTGTSKDK